MFFLIIFHQTECQMVGGGKFCAVEKVLKAKRKKYTGLGGYLQQFYYFCSYT